MLHKVNGSRAPSASQSISKHSSKYSFKSSNVISPFLKQLKTFEDRINKAYKTASKTFRKQSQQYSLYSASILKQAKQMISEGSCVKLCDPALLQIVQGNDSSRERQIQVIDKVRNFRARSFQNSRWRQTANTSMLTDKLTEVSYRSRIQAPGKQNQVSQNLKAFLNHKKKPLKKLNKLAYE